MVTFGGIHFNFHSLGKQDSTMVISACKNRSWHEREQVWHILLRLETNPTNLKTDVTHGIQEAGFPWIASIDRSFDRSIYFINSIYYRAKAIMPFYSAYALLFVVVDNGPVHAVIDDA
jgi:hypothetical protein